MGTELQRLLTVLDEVRDELHPDLPSDFLKQVVLIEEETGEDLNEAIRRIRTLVFNLTATNEVST